MRGVYIKKANVIAEDDRRKIVSILNGEIGVRDIHILHMKEGGKILGNHFHWYPEIMYIMKGGGTWYLKNRMIQIPENYDELKDKNMNDVYRDMYMEVRLEEGDIMIKAPFITHTAVVDADSIILDGSSESWINEDWNHIREVLK